MYQAKDVMTTEIATILPEQSVSEAIDLLLSNRVSGAPVVDADGSLIGIISEFQLLEIVYDPQVRSRSVREFMTTPVISVDEHAQLSRVTSMFITNRIRRIPVVEGNRVVGIITRSDLLRYVVKNHESLSEVFSELRALA